MMPGRHVRKQVFVRFLRAHAEGRRRHVHKRVHAALHQFHQRIMTAGVAGFPERSVFALGIFAQNNADAPAAHGDNAARNATVKIAGVLICGFGHGVLALILIHLARNNLPAALFNQHCRVGKQARGIHAGHRRAHQHGRAVLEFGGHDIQSLEATRRKTLSAEVVAGGHAAKRQLRRNAQVCPCCASLTGGADDTFQISGHVAGNGIALQ